MIELDPLRERGTIHTLSGDETSEYLEWTHKATGHTYKVLFSLMPEGINLPVAKPNTTVWLGYYMGKRWTLIPLDLDAKDFHQTIDNVGIGIENELCGVVNLAVPQYDTDYGHRLLERAAFQMGQQWSQE